MLTDPMAVQSFLQRALMPLHKPKCVGMYHQQLAYCVTQASGPESFAAAKCPGLLVPKQYTAATAKPQAQPLFKSASSCSGGDPALC